MNAKLSKGAAKRAKQAAAASSALDRVRPWLLAGLAAICVARPLVPSEGVSWLGDGLGFDMLLLVLAAGYLLWAAARGTLVRPLGAVDACVGALVAMCMTSAFFGASEGNPRYTIDMLWEWTGLGLVYFLTRQLVRTAAEARALAATMFALAVVVSAFGFYQVLVSLPADRARYAADPERVMQEALGQVFPSGSLERARLEDRLQSTEPLATFALTNSLAGFLVAWLVAALGMAWAVSEVQLIARTPDGKRSSRDFWISMARTVGFALAILAVAGCLLLTKSRSAYVALGVCTVLLPFCGAGWRRINRKYALAGGVAVLLLVGGAIVGGGLDAKVLTEASKSLGFRWQYWRATLSMIGDHPWLGVGPGNFQDYYTQFKLPEASEEIRDPHNFLLEVWATCGTFALMALVAALAMFAWRLWHARDANRLLDPAASRPRATRSEEILYVAIGGSAGFLLAFLVGPLSGYSLTELQLGCGLAVVAAVVAVLWPWIVAGPLPPGALALGVLALGIHWLAAGGIAFPGVAGSFWILMALALNVVEGEPGENPRPRQPATRLLLLLGFVLVGAAAAACYYTAFAPVTRLHTAMSQAAQVAHPQARIVAYLEAASVDPLSADPWFSIAQLEMEKLRQNRATPASYQNFLDTTAKVLDLRPHSSSTWRQIGAWYAEIYRRGQFEKAGEAAVDQLRRAVELYPTSAAVRADLALALDMVGKRDIAQRQAEQALALDQKMPHADRKLPREMRDALEALRAELR